jgi:O-antigen ligase
MNKLPVIDKYIARIMMVTLFLPMKWQVYVAIVTCVYFVARSLAGRQFPPKKDYISALFLGSGFLLYLFSVPLTPPEYRNAVWHWCEREESLILIPFAFALIAQEFKAVITGELVYFVIACFIACVAGNADYFYHYFLVNTELHQLSHVRYRIIFESFTGIHPTYMSVYLCFAICILATDKAGSSVPLRTALPKYMLLYILLVFLLSLLAKSPLIALGIIAIHYGYVHRRVLYRYKWTMAGVAGVVAATGFFIPFFRQRIGELSQLFGNTGSGNAISNSLYARKMIVNIDTELLRRNWLTGVGPGRMLQALQEKYFFYSIANNMNVGQYDPHNQYFALWLSFGILGPVVLLAILATHFIRAIKLNNNLYLYLLILLFVTFFTETFLSRQQGVLFYSIFTSLFFFSGKPGKS